jgi:hypothetical protein
MFLVSLAELVQRYATYRFGAYDHTQAISIKGLPATVAIGEIPLSGGERSGFSRGMRPRSWSLRVRGRSFSRAKLL